jgi:hypothetical protein
MDLKEMGINMRTSVDLAQDRNYWRAFVNDIEPLGFISLGFMRRTSLI